MIVHKVYICGPTDCFLRAIFRDKQDAIEWAEENKLPEGYHIISQSDSAHDWEDE